MAIRIGINGFGRIGRLAYRYATEVEGVEVVASTAEEFTKFIKAEIVKWARVVALSGARAE